MKRINAKWVNITAILLSPVVAVIISLFISNWMIEQRNEYMVKSQLLRTIAGRVFNTKDPEFLSALNSVRIVFHDDKKVLAKWRISYDTLRSNKEDTKLCNQKFVDLVYVRITQNKRFKRIRYHEYI